jgi:hypothetical protein
MSQVVSAERIASSVFCNTILRELVCGDHLCPNSRTLNPYGSTPLSLPYNLCSFLIVKKNIADSQRMALQILRTRRYMW